MANTQGIHHLGLTVSDVKAASAFFIEALGFKQVNEVPTYPAIFVSDGTIMLTLWQVENPATATPFDRKTNLGLHHFALRVAEKTELATLHEQLLARDDVTIEFAPEALSNSGIEHMMCRIPGNLRLELIKL
ncbi:glyoxalase [Marinomonas ushuaiensis DSM 15871]|uniref:Glyoxalase n=1 Tax=Marinomonas ushuaiensis DSM 15871 TaxID=1122207 RepID=X7E8J8_9GAMM|nr:VOC family protein [Marinomonas ushuaiensis]ETX12185.1 glyoxalase [Marinomonas ushuaiensis DSM 15871]